MLLFCHAGHSKGGDTVLTYAGKYDDVPLVVNVSGRFFLGKGQAAIQACLSASMHAQ